MKIFNADLLLNSYNAYTYSPFIYSIDVIDAENYVTRIYEKESCVSFKYYI